MLIADPNTSMAIFFAKDPDHEDGQAFLQRGRCGMTTVFTNDQDWPACRKEKSPRKQFFAINLDHLEGLDSCKEGIFFAKNRKSESAFLMQRTQAIVTILSLANLDYPDGQYL